MTETITPWYLIPEALALLADCAENEPADIRYTHQGIRYRDEWRAYDDEDERVRRLASIKAEVLEPLLQDNERYRLAGAAGVGVSVENAIDAVCREPYCARNIYEIEEVRIIAAQITAAMDSRRAAA